MGMRSRAHSVSGPTEAREEELVTEMEMGMEMSKEMVNEMATEIMGTDSPAPSNWWKVVDLIQGGLLGWFVWRSKPLGQAGGPQ